MKLIIFFIAYFSFIANAATLYWDFVESGGNVTATITGNFDNTYYSPFSSSVFMSFDSAADRLYSLADDVGGNYYPFSHNGLNPGEYELTTLNTTEADSASGSFGFETSFIYWGSSYGDTLDPTDTVSASLTWNSKTIADLFDSDPNFSQVGDTLLAWSYNSSNGATTFNDHIFLRHTSAASVVPEPHSLLFITLSCIGLLFSRKRQKQTI